MKPKLKCGIVKRSAGRCSQGAKLAAGWGAGAAAHTAVLRTVVYGVAAEVERC